MFLLFVVLTFSLFCIVFFCFDYTYKLIAVFSYGSWLRCAFCIACLNFFSEGKMFFSIPNKKTFFYMFNNKIYVYINEKKIKSRQHFYLRFLMVVGWSILYIFMYCFCSIVINVGLLVCFCCCFFFTVFFFSL